jgi:hypothetical protein
LAAAPGPNSGVVCSNVGLPHARVVRLLWRAGSPWRSVEVAMLPDRLFPHAALPSSGGHIEDAFGALLETISCVIATSLSGTV